uniref:Uncharacterized protein n=1 Tax=Rhizophora mucronata TaxID=61149 RepID=A0A2P2PRB5_RHIMU
MALACQTLLANIQFHYPVGCAICLAEKCFASL